MYKANETIKLSDEIIDEIDGEAVEIPVRVILEFWPQPMLLLKTDRSEFNRVNKRNFCISLKGIQKTYVATKHIDASERTLIPIRMGSEIITISKDQNKPIQSVEFGVINFPSIHFQHDKIRLENASWLIDICEEKNLDKNLEILKKNPGYAITHMGKITHKYNETFSVECAKKLLSSLRWFFSFVYGKACALTLINGKDETGQKSWIEWGIMYYPYIWNNLDSRSVHLYSYKFLMELFPKFLKLFEKNTEWEQSLIRTIDWYLNSNNSAVHAGIILTQAALERITFQIVGKRQFKEKTGEYIAQLLKELKIDLEIPSCYAELAKFHKYNNHDHAPHTLVVIRDHYVHPQKPLKGHHRGIDMEAWNLGQRYIESILLKKMNFDRPYKMANESTSLLNNGLLSDMREVQ